MSSEEVFDDEQEQLDRYKRASVNHHALQVARGKLGWTKDASLAEMAALSAVEAALDLAIAELAAARDAYLNEPFT